MLRARKEIPKCFVHNLWGPPHPWEYARLPGTEHRLGAIPNKMEANHLEVPQNNESPHPGDYKAPLLLFSLGFPALPKIFLGWIIHQLLPKGH